MQLSLANLAVFVAAVAFAVTPAIRHDEGWLESCPLMFFSCLFFVGLLAESTWLGRNTRRLPADQLDSIRIRRIECVIAALAILLSLVVESCRPLFAAHHPDDTFDRLDWAIRGLAFGGMMLAMPVPNPRGGSTESRLSWWTHVLFWPAAIYLAHRLIFEQWTFIVLLVNIAIEAVEASQSVAQYAFDSGSLYAGIEPDLQRRGQAFFPFCLAAMIPIGLTSVVYLQYLRRGETPFAKYLVVAVCLGLVASCWFPVFLVCGGLMRYSPPMAEATFSVARATMPLVVAIALLGALFVSRVGCHKSSTTGVLLLESAHLYHRSPYVLVGVFVMWVLSIVSLLFETSAWLGGWGREEFVWTVFGDVKMYLLAAMGCRALGMTIRSRGRRDRLLEFCPTSGCSQRRYGFAVLAGMCLFVLSAPAIFWFEYVLGWLWMKS